VARANPYLEWFAACIVVGALADAAAEKRRVGRNRARPFLKRLYVSSD